MSFLKQPIIAQLQFEFGSVTAHSGLAHLAQLTTIYTRGLLGAKYLFT
jgi:hypothetical protein